MEERMTFVKGQFKKVLAGLISAAVLVQSPAYSGLVFAEPVNGTVSPVSEDAIRAGTPVGLSVDEPAEPSGGEARDISGDETSALTGREVSELQGDETAGLSDNDAPDLSGNETEGISGNSVMGEGQAVVGGYIEMPWDNNTPVVSDTLDYSEALKEMVEEQGEDEGEEAAGIVSEPETIESRFPAGSDEEVQNYLKSRYPATRSQSPYGTCWAHSSVALSEFYMINHGLKDNSGLVEKDADYSELALAYFCYNQAPDPVNGDTGDRISFNKNAGKGKTFLDFGGNLNFAAQSLMRYNGVTNDDADAAYSNAENVLQNGLAGEYARSLDEAHLKNEYLLNIRENPKIVKQAIKENGIVGVSIFADDSYMNFEKNAFYNNVNTSTNHAVAVVGWDDDYPASNFKTDPGKNGAWLVRNSWTVNTGFSYYSYFWLSYCDKSLADTAYVFEMADRDRGEYYNNNYNYDSQLHNVTAQTYSKYANVFTAVKNSETLKAVQIDSTIQAPGRYSIKIYKNLSDSSNPESGTLIDAASVQGTASFAGRYTVPLNADVKLSEGENFSVVVTADKPVDRELDFLWNGQIDMNTSINPGESFGYRGTSWTDLAGDSVDGRYGNLCIRALTDSDENADLPENIKSLSVKNRTNMSVTLLWSSARDAEGYEIWRFKAAEGTWSRVGTTGASVRKYQDTGLSSSTDYQYKVYPVKNGLRNDAGVSPVVSARTLADTPGLEVTYVGNYTAEIRWDPIDGCDGYECKYGMKNGGITYRSTTTEAKVIARRLNPGTLCFVRVCAYNTDEGGNIVSRGEYGEKEFTTGDGTGHAVTSLKAEPYTSNSVKLTWDNQREALYTTEWSPDGINWSNDGGPYNYGQEKSELNDYIWNLDPDTNYYFRVRAFFRKNEGEDVFTSDAVRSYTMLPASSVTNAEAEEDAIKISWTAVSKAAYYSIYRRESSASEYLPLKLVPASDVLQYSDTTALPGRLYYYRVFGCRSEELTDSQGENGGGYGTSIPLERITDLTVSNVGSTTAKISWSPVRGAQGYIIKESVNDSYIERDRIDAGNTSYTITGLTPNTRYCFLAGAFTDYAYGGGIGQYFTTKKGDPAQTSFFNVDTGSIVYDGQGHGATVTCNVDEITAAGFTVSYGKVVDGSVSSYTTSLPVNAGTYRIRIVTGASTYYIGTTLTDPDWEFTISPKTITPTLTLDKDTFTYSGGACKPGVTVKDGNTVLVSGRDYEVSYSNNINAGTGRVTVSSKAGSNYTFNSQSAYFTIEKAQTSVAIAGGNRTVTYGEENLHLSASAALPGGQTGSWTWSSDSPSVAAVDASTGEVSIKGAGQALITAVYSSNNTEGSGSITITVDKALLTVTAKDKSITYGDEPAGNGLAFSGFVKGDTSAVLKGEAVYSFDYARYANVGNSYRITPSGLSADNYSITYLPGKLTVEPKEAALEWSHTSYSYTGDAFKPAAAVSNLVNNDSCTVSVTGERTDAGTYTAAASALSNPNYRLPSDRSVSFTIEPAAYADKTASGSARYGNPGQADLGSLIVPGGLLKTGDITASDPDSLLSEAPSVSGTSLNFTFKNDPSMVGRSAEVTVGVDGGKNYQDYSVIVTLTVLDKTAQRVTFSGVTGGNVTKTYGDPDFSKTATSDGGGAITYSSSNEDVAAVNAAGRVTIKKAGQTTITASAGATDSCAEGTASYTLTVERKEIGISWTQTSFTYDGTGHTPFAEASGLKSGDSCNLTVTGGQTGAGTYSATVTGLDNENYRLPSGLTGEFTISKRPVKISGIKALNKVYDGTGEVQLDCSDAGFDGKIDGDVLTVTAEGTFTDVNAGDGRKVNIRITGLGGADAVNYVLKPEGNQTEATADITRRPVTVRAKDQTIPLKGSIEKDASWAVLTGNVPGHSLSSVTLTASSAENVTSSGTITPTAAVIKSGNAVVTGNYDISYETGTLRVTKITPAFTAPSAGNLTYDTRAQELVSPGASPSGTLMKYSLTENGVYDTAIPTGISAGNYRVWYRVFGGDNYRDTEPESLSVTIKKAPLEGATVVLGDGLTYSGAVRTQTVSKVTLRGNRLDESEYVITGNTALNAGRYELTVSASEDGNCTGSVKKTFTVARKQTVPTINVKGSYRYTGSPIKPEFTVLDGEQELVSTDYSAVFKDNINAGTGRIVISEMDGGNYSFDRREQQFQILRATHGNPVISANAAYGTSNTMDLADFLEPGASFGEIRVSVGEELFETKPVLSGNVLSYTFREAVEDTDRPALVEISVTGAANYDDYSLTVSLMATSCLHPDRILRGKKEATCTEKGYTGDLVCTSCGRILEQGRELDIDPDKHLFDDGVVTEPAGFLKEGIKTFTCLRCGHKRTEAIPRIEGSGDMEELIRDTGDLSGNAAPTVDVSEDENGRKTETVKIGGEEISKTVTDTESGLQTTETRVWIGGLKKSYTYTGSQIKPEFHVYDGTVLLKENTDYSVKIKNNINVGEADITVKFKGNYKGSGSESAHFTISPAVLGRDIKAGETGLALKKGAQKVVPVLTHTLTGKNLSAGYFICDPQTVEGSGEFDVTVTSNDKNFTGKTTVKVRVTGDKNLLLSNARVTFNPGSYAYTGGEIIPEPGTYTLKAGGTALKEGEDFRVAGLYNNTDPGKASIVFEALSGNSAGYVGSRTASFKITGKKELKSEKEGFSYQCPESVPYAKGGAKPAVMVKDGTKTLKEGTDYTLSYKNNKALSSGTRATVTVKGKGMYRGSIPVEFTVVKQNIKAISGNILAEDQFVSRSRVKSPKVTITDTDGSSLKSRQDFTVGKVIDDDPENTDTEGKLWVKVTGTGCYEGEAEVCFKYMKPAFNINKAKQIRKISDQIFTGQKIELSYEALSGILSLNNGGSSQTLYPGRDFVVAGYSNNVRKGTARVTLKGSGAFGGTKVLTFKIVQKPVDYKGALIGGDWK